MSTARAPADETHDGLALLTDIAPGTASVVAYTGESANVDLDQAKSEIHRASAILGVYMKSLLAEEGLDHAFSLLETVQAVLKDAVAIIEFAKG